jgi:DNA end-binding protein Ku
MAASVWKGHITFGLVSLPVRLAVAARSETIGFNQLHKKDHSRVKQVLYCQAENEPIERSEICKGFEYEKGKYVVIEDDDIKKIQPKTAKVMEILEFVKAEELDAVYLESSYYLQPEEAGEKPYTLLFEAMRRSGMVGIAKATMHQREHIVVVRPGKHGLLLHTLYYQDEVRALDEFRTTTDGVKERELAMAQSLIEALAAPFDMSKYRDTYRETLRGMIDAKIQGQEIVAAPQAEEIAPVVDLMEALRVSLEALKKPATAAATSNVVPMPGEAEPRKKAAGKRR